MRGEWGFKGEGANQTNARIRFENQKRKTVRESAGVSQGLNEKKGSFVSSSWGGLVRRAIFTL
jgi:hypothetical protein